MATTLMSAADATPAPEPAFFKRNSLPAVDEKAPLVLDDEEPAPTTTASAQPPPAFVPGFSFSPAQTPASAGPSTPAPAAGEPRRLSQPELIEKLFQDAEEESARRAAAEEALSPIPQEDVIPPSKRASLNLPPLTVPTGGRRRNGSVSISRFGAPTDRADTPESSVPATPSRLSAFIAQNSPYGHYDAFRSRETIASTSSTPEHVDQPEDTVTQITKIPGRSRSATLTKAVGAAARRLSRAASKEKDALHGFAAPGESVVIGVSVQSATVHVLAEDADAEPGARTKATSPTLVVVTATATADAAEALAAARPTKSHGRRMSVVGGKDWLKGIAARFRRKSTSAV